MINTESYNGYGNIMSCFDVNASVIAAKMRQATRSNGRYPLRSSGHLHET